MSNLAKKLGDNIRRIRLAKDMTQGDLWPGPQIFDTDSV